MTDAPRSEFLNELGSDYHYGFHDPETSSFKSNKGLSEDVVRQISAYKEEPEWIAGISLKCL
jgi:Fe-S cluster assembly protein SufB